jgi:hypothetical protein
MQRKVDAGEEHENDRDETDRIAVEIADAEIVCGETADGDRGEGVAQGVESAHARQHVASQTADRKTEIDVPQRFGGLGNAWRQLGVLDRTRRFGAVQLHTADTQHGQHGDGEDDDAHAAEPLQLLPIIEYGAR